MEIETRDLQAHPIRSSCHFHLSEFTRLSMPPRLLKLTQPARPQATNLLLDDRGREAVAIIGLRRDIRQHVEEALIL